jgi:hypothetical protein
MREKSSSRLKFGLFAKRSQYGGKTFVTNLSGSVMCDAKYFTLGCKQFPRFSSDLRVPHCGWMPRAKNGENWQGNAFQHSPTWTRVPDNM